MNASDTARVQNYLRQRFGNKRLSLARRENKDDSADLMLEDEFIGVVFQDDEDGEVCFHVQISILEEDLNEVGSGAGPTALCWQAQAPSQPPALAMPIASANITTAIIVSSTRQALGRCICGASRLAP